MLPPRAVPVSCAVLLGLFVVGSTLADPWVWLAGDRTVDAFGTWWYQWWVAHALGELRSPMHADVLFFPWGKDILRHTGGNLLDVALLTPVRWLVGPAVAWNLLVFVAVATNAWAASAWARRLGASTAGIVLVEVLVGLHPFVLHELRLGRPTQAILAPLLLALAAGDHALETGSRRSTVVAAVLLALTGWTYWYAASFGAIALILLAVARGPRGLGPRFVTLSVLGLGALLLTSPLVVPLATSLLQGDVPGLLPLNRWWAGAQDYTTAEGAAVLISTLGPWGGAGLLSVTGWSQDGFVLGAATLLPLLFLPRRWILVCLAILAIAVGPFPLGLQNPVYLLFVEAFPPFERLYWPIRAVSVLVAASVAGSVLMLARVPERARVLLVAGLAIGSVGELYLRSGLPIGRWKTDIPAPLDCLEGAGIVLPYGEDQEPLVWQTLHEAPMLNGMAERSKSLVPGEQQALRTSNTWLRALLYAPVNPNEPREWTEADKAAMYTLGYRWVVLRPDTLLEPDSLASPSGRLREARRTLRPLVGAPLVEGERVIVYAPWGGLAGCSGR